MNTTAVAALLAELAAHTPRLPRARCRGRSDLFDAEHPAHTDQAIALCRRCPELARCAAWAATQNPFRLSGVIAGRRYYCDPKKKGTP